MPRVSRREILSRFRAMIARGEPIIGGGAGTGLSAKCEEAGGIDLIVIYNSGRYRMAGRGSLAGMLAYGNANEIVVEMAREVLPVVRATPVLAGVNESPRSASPACRTFRRSGSSTARFAPVSRKRGWATPSRSR
jgi:predicted TIM-barrel enzyme